MLFTCLDYLCSRLNQSVRNTFGITEEIVLLTSPAAVSNAQHPQNTQNRILLFVSHLERDPFSQHMSARSSGSGASLLMTNKPLYLNITLVMAASFTGSNYPDGLKLLSHLLAFFHRNPLFTHANAPDLPGSIEQISMEMEGLTLEQVNHIWGMIGSHYLPSAVYKIRAVIPDSEAILSQAEPLTSPEFNLNS